MEHSFADFHQHIVPENVGPGENRPLPSASSAGFGVLSQRMMRQHGEDRDSELYSQLQERISAVQKLVSGLIKVALGAGPGEAEWKDQLAQARGEIEGALELVDAGDVLRLGNVQTAELRKRLNALYNAVTRLTAKGAPAARPKDESPVRLSCGHTYPRADNEPVGLAFKQRCKECPHELTPEETNRVLGPYNIGYAMIAQPEDDARFLERCRLDHTKMPKEQLDEMLRAKISYAVSKKLNYFYILCDDSTCGKPIAWEIIKEHCSVEQARVLNEGCNVQTKYLKCADCSELSEIDVERRANNDEPMCQSCNCPVCRHCGKHDHVSAQCPRKDQPVDSEDEEFKIRCRKCKQVNGKMPGTTFLYCFHCGTTLTTSSP